MEGFRLLENGDLRVSESGVLRSTEGFNDADVSLTAVGSKLTASVFGAIGSVQLDSTSTLVSNPKAIKRTTVPLDSSGTVEALGSSFQNAFSSLVGVGSQGTSGHAVRAAVGALQGSSVLTPTGDRIRYALSNLQGVGTQVASGLRIRYGIYSGFNEEAIRVTSSGDTRVTEDGNIRITGPLVYNEAEGTLVGISDFTKFNSLAYVKKDGVWYRMTPNAKHEGAWKVPTRSYKNINGNWKRIY